MDIVVGSNGVYGEERQATKQLQHSVQCVMTEEGQGAYGSRPRIAKPDLRGQERLPGESNIQLEISRMTRALARFEGREVGGAGERDSAPDRGHSIEGLDKKENMAFQRMRGILCGQSMCVGGVVNGKR